MSTTGMKQRCWEHDYCSPSFYMITLVTEPRRACLSVLKTGADAGPESGHVLALSPIGEVVRDVWRRTSAVYPGVEACECVVMPDHFHGILWVKERLARPVGHIVKAFKRVSTEECRSRGLLLPPDRRPAAPALGPAPAAAPAAGSHTLWQEGFQDSILLHKGQLKAMANYIADNPRRLAAVRAQPDLFTVVAEHTLAPGRICAMVGNRHLLQHPLKRQVQVSRRSSAREIAALKEELLYAADHGTVLVSPCISPGEKEIVHAALAAGHPAVLLQENGFPPLFKPAGRYFDACSSGRLLIVAPFPFHRDRRTITREQCLGLNEWARWIAGTADAASAGGAARAGNGGAQHGEREAS